MRLHRVQIFMRFEINFFLINTNIFLVFYLKRLKVKNLKLIVNLKKLLVRVFFSGKVFVRSFFVSICYKLGHFFAEIVMNLDSNCRTYINLDVNSQMLSVLSLIAYIYLN